MMLMIMMLTILTFASVRSFLFLPLFYPQSCHDEQDEDGEEVKSFEVGDQSLCLSVCQSLW